MIVFPSAKINIGLQVLNKRPDGYHEIETLFYPIKLYDVLEVLEAKETTFHLSGIEINDQDKENNICSKAYQLLKRDFKIPPVEVHLHKNIPIGAGLGGGSSDGAFMLKLLNELFKLEISSNKLEEYAKYLGADCPFFIKNEPVYATGIGTDFANITVSLEEYHIVVINPRIHIVTAKAYDSIVPKSTRKKLKNYLLENIDLWKDFVFNDFELAVVNEHPEIIEIKELLYRSGALYSAMSGSGSAVYGIFKNIPSLEELNTNYEVFYC